MKTFRQEVKLPASEVKRINALLEMQEADLRDMEYPEDTSIETFTVNFGGNIEADIKVCSGTHNFFIDPVLFENGSEVCLLDTEDDILGEYVFEYNGNDYIVDIVLDDTQLISPNNKEEQK